MTTLIILRHGQSMANIQGIFAGNIDIPLSPLGYAQAEKTAEYIAENYNVDKVYASDLSRAFETGRAASEKTGAEIVSDRSLREIFAGFWEGENFETIKEKYGADYELWKNDIGLSQPTGGESVAEVQKRSCEAFERIARENDGKTIVVATHAHPVRTAVCKWKNVPLEKMKEVPWVSNASVTVAEYADGKFTLKSVGYDAHLISLKTDLPHFA